MSQYRLKLYPKKNFSRMKLLVADLGQAISGAEYDFTKGNLSRAVLLLSVPMVLEMIMESVFAIVDIYFVSRLGADAVATVGITESVITLVYTVAIGLSMATTAMVSRRIGEGNRDAASRTGFQAVALALLLSLVIAVPGVIYAERILELMGAGQEIVENYSGYMKWMLGGNTVIMLLFVINAVFRSAGDAFLSMRVLWLGNLINIVLDPCLILGLGPFPELGVTGAAIATNIGRGIAVLYQIYILFFGRSRIRITRAHITFRPRILLKLLKLGAGGMGQFFIATSSWIIMMRIVSEFGASVVAGYTIAIRLVVFALLPSSGISNAAATLVGQNLGAKQPQRAEQSVWLTGKVNTVILTVIGVLFIAWPESFLRFFIHDPEVISAGVQSLRIISAGFLFYGLGMVLVNSFNGAGDTATPTWINFICFWIIEIPLAWLLAIVFGWNEKGVFYSIIIAESLLTIISFLIFRKGNWKLKSA